MRSVLFALSVLLAGCTSLTSGGLGDLRMIVDAAPLRGQPADQVERDEAACLAGGIDKEFPRATYGGCLLAKGYRVVVGYFDITPPATLRAPGELRQCWQRAARERTPGEWAALAVISPIGAAMASGDNKEDLINRPLFLSCLEPHGYTVVPWDGTRLGR